MAAQRHGRWTTTGEEIIKCVVEKLEGVTGLTESFKAKGDPLRHIGDHIYQSQFYVAARLGAVFWRNEFHLATGA